MEPRASSQRTGATPILRMDPTTFHVAVAAAVASVMTQLNTNNPNINMNGANVSKHDENQGS